MMQLIVGVVVVAISVAGLTVVGYIAGRSAAPRWRGRLPLLWSATGTCLALASYAILRLGGQQPTVVQVAMPLAYFTYSGLVAEMVLRRRLAGRSEDEPLD